MDWATIETTLQAAVSALVSPRQVMWSQQARPMRVPGAAGDGMIVLLDLIGSRPIGVDFLEYDLNGTTGNLDESAIGNREITVAFRVESFRQTGAYSARALAEELRTKLRFSSVATALAPACMALMSIGPSTDASWAYDGRTNSAFVFDAVYSVPSIVTDLPAEGKSYIDNVEVTSDIDDVDGNPLPASLQMNEETLP